MNHELKFLFVFFLTLGLLFAIPQTSVAAGQITLDTNKESYQGGDSVEIRGSVQEAQTNQPVAIEVKDPKDNTILIRTVTVDAAGQFELSFKIPGNAESGNYEIVANSNVNGESVSITKTISSSQEAFAQEATQNQQQPGGGCLIATATYGSEMAPQVQMLREIRDNQLMATESGKSFITSFNSFYYSFSPAVADLERQNPAFKEAVKIALTPLLLSLSLLQNVDLTSESNVLLYGISLVSLNTGLYFGTPAVALWKLRQKSTTKTK